MGRKQKLRQEKRNIKNKAVTAEVTAAAAAAVATTFSSEDAIVETAAEKALAARVRKEKGLALDNQLPKSDMYVQAMAGTDISNRGEQWELFKRGVTEDMCVHSMYYMGVIIMSTTDEKRIHLALPWILEGAIRGNYSSTWRLLEGFYGRKVDALHFYWGEFASKLYNGTGRVHRMQCKNFKKGLGVERECVICSKF